MNFTKTAGMALLAGWIIGIVFAWLKLPAPVPPLLGLFGAGGVLLGGYCYDLFYKFIFK
ncbi:MAG: DUF1427 family protein [Chroococcidiopsidaceae cyanobacterium CP_BM_ER_R8_30]|nr:DUF1427 family protein [Chroococcidiopsidaceae cyanobacterium CP_BM_ER_R8_30]